MGDSTSVTATGIELVRSTAVLSVHLGIQLPCETALTLRNAHSHDPHSHRPIHTRLEMHESTIHTSPLRIRMTCIHT